MIVCILALAGIFIMSGVKANRAEEVKERELIQTLVQESIDTAIVAERNRIMRGMIDRDLGELWPEMRELILPAPGGGGGNGGCWKETVSRDGADYFELVTRCTP